MRENDDWQSFHFSVNFKSSSHYNKKLLHKIRAKLNTVFEINELLFPEGKSHLLLRQRPACQTQNRKNDTFIFLKLSGSMPVSKKSKYAKSGKYSNVF